VSPRSSAGALKGGQRRFHVHVFPFRMSEENLKPRGHMRWAEFWHELKPGHDAFEASRLPPGVWVCQGHYAISSPAPGLRRQP
jgi:murein L,D-transpeptidase YafK